MFKVAVIKSFFLLSAIMVQAQLELKDLKFDYNNYSISYEPILKKFEKGDKFYSDIIKTFKYNYPAEIENASGGVWYRGKVSCTFVKRPAEAEVSALNNFEGLVSCKTAADETVNVPVAGTYNTTKGYIRNYSVVYPVTMTIYYKGNIYKTIDFFTAAAPLNFRLTKELIEPTAGNNTAFTSVQEIVNYENAGRVNKAAEKFAFFEASKKVDEILKNYIGSFDYDFLLGPVTVKKKKTAEYPELVEAVDIMEDGIKAYKKRDLPARDSLINKALNKFLQLSSSSDARYNKLAKEVFNYNILVCYSVLENAAKTDEYYAMHLTSEVQKAEHTTGNYILGLIQKTKERNNLKKEEKIHL